jgi:hypothetical protein
VDERVASARAPEESCADRCSGNDPRDQPTGPVGSAEWQFWRTLLWVARLAREGGTREDCRCAILYMEGEAVRFDGPADHDDLIVALGDLRDREHPIR